MRKIQYKFTNLKKAYQRLLEQINKEGIVIYEKNSIQIY